jgi:hypothetical protein
MRRGQASGSCVRLAHYLHQHQESIEKDYAYISIDDRFPHGEDVMKRLRGDAERASSLDIARPLRAGRKGGP